MAAAIDLLELTKMVSANNDRYPQGKDPTVYRLIPVHFDTLKAAKHSSVDIVLQNEPEIACTLNLVYSDECVRMNLKFKSRDLSPKLKYKASLYYLNWNLKMTLLESLSLENITNDSIYHFSLPLKWFINDRDNCLRKILLNDHWFLYCEITRKDEVVMPSLIVESPKSEMAGNFYKLYNEDLFTDVKITCWNEEFFVHKLILSARSSGFQAMFESKMKESGTIEITINDVEPEILRHMLRFIYTESVNDFKDREVEKLLAAANKYALENLKVICLKEICKSVTDIEKAFEVLAIAENCNVIGFKKTALNFIKNIGRSS